ncbi:MAG: site-specific DNA-methyltransferase, partial [Candidatus Cloacimonadota bacterium]
MNKFNTYQDNEIINKLKNHLKVLFQFDSAELDFGIYRIMNYKRKEIENFIDQDLIKAVDKEFKKHKKKKYENLDDEIKKTEDKIEENLGKEYLTNGKLKDKYGDLSIVKKYYNLLEKKDEVDIIENIQLQVFNDLYNFFSRYYEDGDFISKRRYSSKQYKYAIPYSGEEVKLYWANFDQYYVKTGEVFKDYEFNKNGWKFIFRTNFAEVEAGNVKGNRKYFFLSPDNPIEINNKICLIKFDYRHLADLDIKDYPVKTKEGKLKQTGIKQSEINKILNDKIINLIEKIEPKSILLTKDPTEKNPDRTFLQKHIYKYTRKITSDFFIHKDLKGFLERELDYFIKTEVLDIDCLDTENEKYFDKHITRAKLVKNIGEIIIEFLAQIEDFQKMLWEKKKFVLKTDYVITIDRVPEEFHKEIIENKEQLKEWEKLGFGLIRNKNDLIAKNDLMDKEYKKLPVDTKYFSQDFKERLLEKLSEKGNLDDLIDGILIKSENWQALNLLLEKYKEKIQCIYIDPPFNTGSDFLYKDNYQDSSWLTLMNNRLNFIKMVLKNNGSFYLHLDENANYYGKILLNKLGFDNIQEISFNTNATKDEDADLYGYKSFGNRFVLKHSTIFNCFNNDYYFIKLWKP